MPDNLIDQDPPVVDTGTPVQTDPTPDPTPEPGPTLEEQRDVLETKVGEGLTKVFGDSGPLQLTPLDDDSKDPDGSKDLDDPQPLVDDGVIDPKNIENAGEAAADGSTDPDAPTLPDSHRRALVAKGWDPDEIDKNLAQYGTEFLKLSSKVYTDRNAETALWAESGRLAKEQQEQSQISPAPVSPAPQPASTPQTPSAIQPVDVEALKQEYGEDALIDRLAAPVNATINAINAILPQLQQAQQAAQQTEIERLSQQVDEFFGGEITEEQFKNRMFVLYKEHGVKTLYCESNSGGSHWMYDWNLRGMYCIPANFGVGQPQTGDVSLQHKAFERVWYERVLKDLLEKGKIHFHSDILFNEFGKYDPNKSKDKNKGDLVDAMLHAVFWCVGGPLYIELNLIDKETIGSDDSGAILI